MESNHITQIKGGNEMTRTNQNRVFCKIEATFDKNKDGIVDKQTKEGRIYKG